MIQVESKAELKPDPCRHPISVRGNTTVPSLTDTVWTPSLRSQPGDRLWFFSEWRWTGDGRVVYLGRGFGRY